MSPAAYQFSLLESEGGRAPGGDCITSDLALLAPEQFTRLYHPLHVKSALLSREPLSFKGAIAFKVRKKGDPTGTMKDWRSVLLQNFQGKVHYAFMRSRLYTLFHAALHVTQTGGVKGRGTDHTNATIRWGLHCFTSLGMSSVVFSLTFVQLTTPCSVNLSCLFRLLGATSMTLSSA